MEHLKKPSKKTTGEIIFPVHDNPESSVALLGDIRSLVESTRIRVAAGINA
ncbi:MAG: hypothetical protein M0R30_05410 [Methanoregula sp.]|jgi:hypothetical protein|uniref:hypothetical protein n=1 Tax=Methanoregula sp. TaxID=2052170 RepID=UPI0025D87479|nr:hypothetical protein [Methanoregula sp.]MCK9631062.1 hypothetical protein [Methanoregula sp.]